MTCSEVFPQDAQLVLADPAESGGLYDAMEALYQSLKGPGVSDGKVSKVLHLKRPGLYPILDSALTRFYTVPGREAAKKYPERGYRRMRWAAIREDLLANRDALDRLREDAGNDEILREHRLNELSDVRLLDIFAWRAQRKRQS